MNRRLQLQSNYFLYFKSLSSPSKACDISPFAFPPLTRCPHAIFVTIVVSGWSGIVRRPEAHSLPSMKRWYLPELKVTLFSCHFPSFFTSCPSDNKPSIKPAAMVPHLL